MKIELELPDWVDKTHIYILAGKELVAYRYLEGGWQIKKIRCDKCGKCCRTWDDTQDFPQSVKGVCVYLVDNQCSLGSSKPFGCCIGLSNNIECLEKYDTLLSV